MDTIPTASATQTKERHITVTPRSLPRGKTYVNLPQIILSGLHLERIGFTIGSKVTVTENPGEIIIRLDGASAEHDPNETPDDRRLARKIKRVTDYQQSTRRPLSQRTISQYLSGQMPFRMQELISRLIDGELCEPYLSRLFELLDSTRNTLVTEGLCESLLWEINRLPPPKRKRPTKQTKTSGVAAKPIPTNTTQQSPQAASAQDNFINPSPAQQVAEPPANLQPREIPQIDGLDPDRSYIRHVLRSLKPLPPPPPRDPAAGPTLREIMERYGPRTKPPYDYPEVSPHLREFIKDDPINSDGVCQPDNPEIDD